jgi:hypothetical protein
MNCQGGVCCAAFKMYIMGACACRRGVCALKCLEILDNVIAEQAFVQCLPKVC